MTEWRSWCPHDTFEAFDVEALDMFSYLLASMPISANHGDCVAKT